VDYCLTVVRASTVRRGLGATDNAEAEVTDFISAYSDENKGSQERVGVLLILRLLG
jgi:hypothetical protein